MKLEFDSNEKPETLRAVAAFALMLAGDIAVPTAAPDDLENAGNGEIVKPITSNVIPFPPAPPVPSNTAHAAVSQVAAPVATAGAAVIPPNAPHAFVPSVAPAGSTFAPSAASAVSATPANQPNSQGTVMQPPFPGYVPPVHGSATLPENWGRPPIPVPQMPPQFTSAQTASFPPPVLSAPASTAAPHNTTPIASNAAGVPAQTGVASASPSVPVEYDSAGLPWDARIHNKGRTKKKDQTWKLQKGLDPVFAQQVVQELIGKKLAAGAPGVPPTVLPPVHVPAPTSTMQAPPPGQQLPAGLPQGPLMPDVSAEARAAWAGAPPPAVGQQYPLGMPGPNTLPAAPAPVPLPPAGFIAADRGPILGFGPVPVPPFPGSTGAPMVPPQPAPAPVPPVAQPGTVGGSNPPVPASGYKQLIDKLTAATQNRTLNPTLVAPTVQQFGVPNMGMLGDPAYAGLLPVISQEFDRLIAGGAPHEP